MSWRTNSIIIHLRTIGRKLGVNRFVMAVVGCGIYEKRFQDAIFGEIVPGDCVWDMGANIGFYSSKFANLVGEDGKVFCFEPSPTNFNHLQTAVALLPNVIAFPIAIGHREGRVWLRQGEDPCGATSRVQTGAKTNIEGCSEVEIQSGDNLIESQTATFPNVIKIDVEGFEFEVLQGLHNTIQNRCLRIIGIEVHFGLLKKRGIPYAPNEIENLLEQAGFCCSWPDSSHIIARRIVR